MLKILFVDDDEDIRDAACHMLRQFVIIPARCGNEAMRYLDEVDLVISDGMYDGCAYAMGRFNLNKILPEGATVSGIVKRVSSSGMSRRIVFLAVVDGKIENISFEMSKALDEKWNDDGSMTVNGCGMDMVFAMVYDLSRTLGKKLENNAP